MTHHSIQLLRQTRWRIAHRILMASWLLAGALNMLHVRGGFLTNHLADLTLPADLYIVFRMLHIPPGRHTLVHKLFGRTPELAALSLFTASSLTEISQHYLPRGVFSGRFDWLDIAAYGLGLLACYVADKLSHRSAVA